MAAFAQLDNEDRAQNCMNGMIRAVKEGRRVWKAFIGYKNVRYHGKANIEPDQTQVQHIIRSFELLATGIYSIEEVRRMMEQEGLRDPDGNPVKKNAFNKLVRRKAYIGIIESFGLNAKAVYPFVPIISEDLFYRVQDMIDGRKPQLPPKYHKNRPDFPLRGLLICQHCGQKMTGSWTQGRHDWYAHYRCIHCTKFNANKITVEKNWCDLLESFQYDTEKADLLEFWLKREWQKRNTMILEHRRTIDHALEDAKQKQKTYAEKNAAGILPDDLAKELITEQKAMIEKLHAERHQLPNVEEDIDILIAKTRYVLEHWRDEWEKHENDLGFRQRLQSLLFPAGWRYSRDHQFATNSPLLLIQIKKRPFRRKVFHGGTPTSLLELPTTLINALKIYAFPNFYFA